MIIIVLGQLNLKSRKLNINKCYKKRLKNLKNNLRIYQYLLSMTSLQEKPRKSKKRRNKIQTCLKNYKNKINNKLMSNTIRKI